jgi:hypothetical protein
MCAGNICKGQIVITEEQIATIRNWCQPEILRDVYHNNISEWVENLVYVLQTNNEPELQEAHTDYTLSSGTTINLDHTSTMNNSICVELNPDIKKKIDEIHKMMLEFTKEIE